jgi:myo-inositol-1(or 4)-monophosphatase
VEYGEEWKDWYLCTMNLQEMTSEVSALVVKVAAYISEQRKTFSNEAVSDKGINQLVSYVDVEAEKQLVNGLMSILPEAGFITEENTSEKGKAEYNWIIDPLDGTTNFIHNLPVYSISVALARNEELLIGIVYEIGRHEEFTAWKDGGAWCNGQKLSVSSETSLQKSLMATGFPYYDYEQMDAYLDTLRYLMKSTHGLRRMGSAAVDLAYVAAGRFEGFFEYGLHAWDVAAGCLLVKEAGGNICDFKGGNDFLFGDSIIASNKVLHETLLGIISEKFRAVGK